MPFCAQEHTRQAGHGFELFVGDATALETLLRACHGLTTASTTTRQMLSSIIMAQHIHLRVSFCSAFALVSALLPWFTNSFALATWRGDSKKSSESEE